MTGISPWDESEELSPEQAARAAFVKERLGYVDVDGISPLEYWHWDIERVLEALAVWQQATPDSPRVTTL